MSVNEMLMAAAGASGDVNYVDDVFSTYLYTGNGTTQTITNGIDLAGKGGLVWIKSRNNIGAHCIFDTARGVSKFLNSADTSASTEYSGAGITSFNANGFSLGADFGANNSTWTQASWTFREAPKFFDVVTYTGNSATQNISHNLGVAPGMIIVKRTSGTTDWAVYHRSLGATNFVRLNTTAASASTDSAWNSTSPTSTSFSVGANALTNSDTQTYVAYLFAHDAGGFGAAGTDNVISCGSFTTDGSGSATVSLGYEPQFLLIKSSSASGNWEIVDAIRGFSEGGYSRLFPNLADAESTGSASYFITSTGLRLPFLTASTTYIYMAIRRPMKVPTSGSEVFSPTVYTGTNADNRLVNTSILTDMVMIKERNDTVAGMRVGDRLRGNPYLTTGTTGVEVNDADSLMTPTAGNGNAFSAMNGVGVGNDATSKVNIDTTSNNHIAWAFKRATGFFDVVCYTGTGVARTVAHNLGVAPEMMIVKSRSVVDDWSVYSSGIPNTDYLRLNATSAKSTFDQWNNTSPTNSVFSLSSDSGVNGSGTTYVALLFASVAGVSKVGSYTGNGSSQTINCGFTAGARFVLIKRTDDVGDWYVWDTARGIIAGNDPYLLLNSSAAEDTSTDYIDPVNSGFELSSTAPAAINANGGLFIFLAIA